MTPEEFAKRLKLAIQGTITVFRPIPKNKRPFYLGVIRQFEKHKTCWSPSGLTAQIVCMYLKENGRSFTLTWSPEERFKVVEK